MDAGLSRGPLSFLGGRIEPAFQIRQVVVPPGAQRAFDSAEWRGSLVVVEQGVIELESLGGDRRTFCSGDVLWLAGLRLLRNSGTIPAVLSATSRRRDEERPNSFPTLRV
jgi:hypothetical protein